MRSTLNHISDDNAETSHTMAVIAAMAERGPSPWRAESPSGDIDLGAVKYAVMTTRSRSQLFRAEGVRDGKIILKSAFTDGSPQLRGPQYKLSADDLAAPCWDVFETYEAALEAIEAHE